MKRIFDKIEDTIAQKGRCVMAIDGPCGSGKSTLAAILAQRHGGEVIPMDDFFLPPSLRTGKRLTEKGGNIHYERFEQEAVKNIGSGRVEWGAFDCSVMDITGRKRTEGKRLIIAEGSYSLHPRFGKYYDFAVFCTVGLEERLKRIEKRSGKEKLYTFISLWIPMEEEYFKTFDIEKKCLFRVTGEKNMFTAEEI